MATIKDVSFYDVILQGIERAAKCGKPVLVSEVKPVRRIEPVSFFEAGRRNFTGERFFWKDPSGQMQLAGLGLCRQMKWDEADGRFFHVEKEWNDLLENRLVVGETEEEGIGPVIFGGFSFDPYKEKTSLWSRFGQTQFHFPVFLLTVLNGRHYLTTNLICSEADSPENWLPVLKARELLLTSGSLEPESPPAALLEEMEINPEKWKDTVGQVVEDLQKEELQKVVLARELRLKFNHPLSAGVILRRLLKEQNDSFVFAFESGKDCFIGASPERLVKKRGKEIFSACVAGSIARGKTLEEDKRLGETLLNDKKNTVEHQYVVRMIREAMEKVCDSVEIPDSPVLMKMRDIQHLYTPVIGKMNSQSTLLQVVELLHPTPALGGYPKEAAVRKIREVEELDRGFYAGPLGWMDANGNGEFAVAIRSGLIQGKEVSLFAGCGIVKDSDPESEYLETKIKFRPMLSALRGD